MISPGMPVALSAKMTFGVPSRRVAKSIATPVLRSPA
jgi:hypothetical protein